MKKTKRHLTILIALILVLATFSCRKKPIAGPSKIEFDAKVLVLNWNKVKGANYYILDLNGERLESNTNSYSFLEYDEGSYDVKIKAIFKNTESIFSNTIRFVISESVDVNIHSNGTYIYWDKIPNAIYAIQYSDNLLNQTVTLEKNNYLIPTHLRDKLEEFKLTVYLHGKILSRTELKFDHDLLRIYQGQEYNINVKNAKALYINANRVETGYTIHENSITLSPLLISRYEGTFHISVVGEENILFKAEIIPETFNVISYFLQPYLNEDVVYNIEYKGFHISSISGLVEDVDYTILRNGLTIKKEFIERYKIENPEATRIKLNLIFYKGEYEKDWYLEIDLETP